MPDVDIDDLKRKNQALQRRVDDLELELQKQKNESKRAAQAIANLRDVLNPLHRAMKLIFGEIDSVDIPEYQPYTTTTTVSVNSPAWETWKQKLGGKKAEFIQALLDTGHPMTSEQLRISTHTGRSTVPQIIHELKKLGLIEKNGDKYSLKQL
jgi:hypothetical protein